MAESETRRKVREKSEKGFTPREIALSLGLSTQAIYKHLAAMKVEAGKERVS